MAEPQNAGTMSWETANWLNQLVFYLIGCCFFFTAIFQYSYRETMWYYFFFSTFLLIIASVNSIFSKSSVRFLVAVTVIMLNSFIIPFAAYSFGKTTGFAVAASLVFIIITIAISPRMVALGALFAAIGFSCFLHWYWYKIEFENMPIKRLEESVENSQHKDRDSDLIDKTNFTAYTVKKDSTLREISSLPGVYNNPEDWPSLYRANLKKVKNPTKKVKAGTILKVPLMISVKNYTVKTPATLREISALPGVFDNADNWDMLFKANKKIIMNPDEIIATGTVLKVPCQRIDIKSDLIKIAILYLVAVFVAYCWRLLILKMYTLYIQAKGFAPVVDTTAVNALEQQLGKTQEDQRLLKEEIALQIIEMNTVLQQKHEPAQ